MINLSRFVIKHLYDHARNVPTSHDTVTWVWSEANQTKTTKYNTKSHSPDDNCDAFLLTAILLTDTKLNLTLLMIIPSMTIQMQHGLLIKRRNDTGLGNYRKSCRNTRVAIFIVLFYLSVRGLCHDATLFSQHQHYL